MKIKTPRYTQENCTIRQNTKSACLLLQAEYEKACTQLFQALDSCEQRLSKQRYLISHYPNGQASPSPTLADYRLFTTLIRFDVIYYPMMKTNIRHIRDYPNLQVRPFPFALAPFPALCSFPLAPDPPCS